MVAAASVDQLAAIDATDEMKALLAAPVLPGQLGLADVYDYFDTEAQGSAALNRLPLPGPRPEGFGLDRRCRVRP